MAATAFDALGDVYEGITPLLPKLYRWELPIAANRPALPYALLRQVLGADELKIQKNPATSGNAGIRHEVLRAQFLIWSIVPAETDAAASKLTAALHPKALTVTGADTVIEVRDSNVIEERHAPPRLRSRPIPRGSEVSTDRVYVANVDVKVRVVYN
jgi:hypothetical protein